MDAPTSPTAFPIRTPLPCASWDRRTEKYPWSVTPVGGPRAVGVRMEKRVFATARRPQAAIGQSVSVKLNGMRDGVTGTASTGLRLAPCAACRGRLR